MTAPALPPPGPLRRLIAASRDLLPGCPWNNCARCKEWWDALDGAEHVEHLLIPAAEDVTYWKERHAIEVGELAEARAALAALRAARERHDRDTATIRRLNAQRNALQTEAADNWARADAAEARERALREALEPFAREWDRAVTMEGTAPCANDYKRAHAVWAAGKEGR